MIPRAALLAVLVVIEGEIVVAVQPAQWSLTASDAEAARGPAPIEGGPNPSFPAGSHPALTVEIGNADLTVRTGSASQFDVSVSQSTAYGIFRAKANLP